MGTSSMVLLCNRAMRLAEHGAVEEAHAHGERALELLKGSGGPDEIGEAMICLALAECKRGKYVLAEGLCRRALKLLQGSGNQRLAVLGHWASGFVAGNLEQIDEASDHLQTAFASADGLLSLREQGTLRSDLAIACRERGDLDEALRLSREALGIMELAGDVQWVADLYNTIGAIHARRGDREAAFQAYESAHAVLGNDMVPQAAECHAELARLELEGGRPADEPPAARGGHSLLAAGQRCVLRARPETVRGPCRRSTASSGREAK